MQFYWLWFVMYFNSSDIDRLNLSNEILIDYFSIKDLNPKAILLFQIGSFYEAFFEDAKILSDITGIIYSSRTFSNVGEISQAGFPRTQDVKIYIKQLLDNNYDVCICDEIVDKQGKIKRILKRKYTKGTIIENELLDSTQNNYICSLLNKNDFVEFSYADVSVGNFYKTKGTLDEINLEINKIEPNEIVILKEQESFFKNKINYNFVLVEYNVKNSDEIIKKYCLDNQKDCFVELQEPQCYNIQNFLLMDEITRRNLELVRTKMFLKKKGSLLWFLNNTKTPMGIRLLKKYLNEPLLDMDEISKRQFVVEKLLNNSDLLVEFEKKLSDFSDLSRVCAKILNSTILPKDLLDVAKCASSFDELNNLINKFDLKYIKFDNKKLSEILNLIDEIKKSIKENPSDEITKGNIINIGYNSELDYLKSKLSDFEKKLLNYEQKERKNLDIANLKISISKTLGYYIEIPKSKVQRLSNDYIKKQELSSTSRYTTNILNELEIQIFNLKYKINEFEYKLYCDIREKSKKFAQSIRQIANEIAKLDVLVSFARCAIEYNFSKPTFNLSGIYIKDGYHPSLLKNENEIIKNDTNLEKGCLIVLTGANMSGKSTYLKHNAIICLLAQIGSFVPAQSADLAIIDKLFVRQDTSDDISKQNSSFMVEMNDLKFIIDNISDSSLVLLDEPAKSTSAKEGGAIARAFLEYILENHQTKIMVATHNFELTKLENEFKNRAFNYLIEDNNSSFNRKIKRGVISSSFAIDTAILADLPDEIINKAKKYVSI